MTTSRSSRGNRDEQGWRGWASREGTRGAEGRFDPAIDPGHFPNTEAAYFWSSSPYADQPGSAWHVYFHYGEAYPNQKSNANPVRLVRGRTVTFGLDNP
ncbi:MAG: DUF1566 domain-containing protein [Deferrisomatales bacterium]|nr:DUF1566 domain-containing protein [Deferrisomatales bacterium]